MARFIVYSFLFIVLINAFSSNEVEARTRIKRDFSDWLSRQKESWLNWGNEKAAAIPGQVKARYQEIKNELSEKRKQLESSNLYQEIKRLEHELLSEANVQDIKENVEANLKNLGDSDNGQLDSIRTVVQSEKVADLNPKVAEAAENIVNSASNKLDDLRNNPLWKSIQAENEKKSEEDNEEEKGAVIPNLKDE